MGLVLGDEVFARRRAWAHTLAMALSSIVTLATALATVLQMEPMVLLS